MPKDDKVPSLRITSRREGFYRCDVQHSAEPKVHPAGTFTSEQIEELKAEPMLIVEEITDK